MRALIIALALTGLLLPAQAHAHPHAWIDLRSRVLLDDEGRMSGLELYWVFDEWYTVFVAEEFLKGDEPATEVLRELGRQNLISLAEYDYFTEIAADGSRLPLGEVERFETGLEDERLWLRFEVPLEAPIDPITSEVSFRVYDPTYYIEVVHLEERPVSFAGNGASRCSAEIREPNPSFESVMLAAAIDRNETGGEGLGRTFAQTVLIDCR